MLLGRTRAIADRLKKDINKILSVTTNVVHVVFIIFYGYSIYSNINNIIFLVIYSILATLALIEYMTYLVTYKKENTHKKQFKRAIRISKYLTNGTMLIVNVVELLNYGMSDFNKILLIVSGVSLLIQGAVELIRIFIERYVDLFVSSVRMDLEIISKISKLKEVQGNIFELLDAPLEAIANKLEGKETDEHPMSKKEQYINKLAAQFKEEEKTNKDIRKKKRKQEVKEKSVNNAKQQQKEIREHLNIIKNKIMNK